MKHIWVVESRSGLDQPWGLEFISLSRTMARREAAHRKTRWGVAFTRIRKYVPAE